MATKLKSQSTIGGLVYSDDFNSKMESQIELMMNDALSFIKILQICRTDETSKWTRKDLEKAVKWSKYFEKVYNKVSQKRPHIKEQFMAKFKSQLLNTLITNERSHQCATLYKLLSSLEFLGTQSLQYMTKCLLENPSLSHEVLQYVPELVIAKFNCYEHCKSYTDSQALLETLKDINSTALDSGSNIPIGIAVTGDSLISSVSLMEELKLMKQQTDQDTTFSYKVSLEVRLDSMSVNNEGMETILISLTLSNDEDSSIMLWIQEDIIQWLRDRLLKNIESSTLCLLFSLPITVLTYTADKSLSFLTLYLEQLIFLTEHNSITHSSHYSGLPTDKNIIPQVIKEMNDCTPYWIALFNVSVSCRERCLTAIGKERMRQTVWRKLSQTLYKEHQ